MNADSGSGVRKFWTPKDAEEISPHLSKIVEWILESGRHLFIGLFGDESSARTKLGSWLRRKDSEFSAFNARLPMVHQSPVGILIALPGRAIPARRRADLLTLIKDTTPEGRPALKQHLENISSLTAPVEPAQYYVRTLTIDRQHRGRGIGKELLQQARVDAVSAGCNQLRLDVETTNDAAMKLYESVGFRRIATGTAPHLEIEMQSMVMPLS
jgi:ribosomal protein S18 acetylase RimI-like enzyme